MEELAREESWKVKVMFFLCVFCLFHVFLRSGFCAVFVFLRPYHISCKSNLLLKKSLTFPSWTRTVLRILLLMSGVPDFFDPRMMMISSLCLISNRSDRIPTNAQQMFLLLQNRLPLGYGWTNLWVAKSPSDVEKDKWRFWTLWLVVPNENKTSLQKARLKGWKVVPCFPRHTPELLAKTFKLSPTAEPVAEKGGVWSKMIEDHFGHVLKHVKTCEFFLFWEELLALVDVKDMNGRGRRWEGFGSMASLRSCVAELTWQSAMV